LLLLQVWEGEKETKRSRAGTDGPLFVMGEHRNGEEVGVKLIPEVPRWAGVWRLGSCSLYFTSLPIFPNLN
jgi:hypothetical protein